MFDPPKDLTPEQIMEKIVEMIWSPSFYEENKERLNSFVLKYLVPPSTLRRQYEAILLHDTWDKLGSISVKSLILHGGKDGLVFPVSAYYLAEHIPNVELFIIDEARHGVLEESWGLVYTKLREFITP